MNGSGPLDFEATIDAKTFNSMLDEMERRLKGVGTTAVNEGSKIDDSFKKAAAAMAAYFSAGFAKNAIKEIGQVRGEFQQLEIALETMLRNKALSDKLMSEIVTFAAKTPFDLKGVASGAKQLLAYGTQAKDIIPTMRKLGDIAAGLSIPFGDLVYLYGTSATQGRIMTKDLMQFAGRGIPVIGELSKILNVSKAQVMELASQGALSFEHLQKVVENLTNETGMFGGMMDKQSKSITGLASNLGDAWDKMLNNIGEANQTTFEDGIKLAIRLTENYETIIDVLKVLIATVGVYKAAVIMNTVAMQGYSGALGLAVIRQNLLNLAQKATPWGIALTGITALVGALYVYNKAVGDTKTITQQINAEVSKEATSLDSLFESAKKAATGTDKRKAAIELINSRYSIYLDNLLTEKSAIEDIEKAQKKATNAIIANIAVKQSKAKLEETLGTISTSFDDKFGDFLSAYSNSFGADRVGEFINSINDAVDKEINARGGIIERGTLEYSQFAKMLYDDFVSDLSKKSGYLKFSFEDFKNAFIGFADIKAEQLPMIDQLQAMIENYQGLVVEKIDPEQVIADSTVKTLAEKLKEIQQLYENYYTWAEHYGEESANTQFANLIKGGGSFLEYLDREIKKIEGRKKKSSGDTSDLSTLLAARDGLTGAEGSFKGFEKMIGDAKDRYKDLIDYISFLNDQIDSTPFDGSELSFQKISLLISEINQAEKGLINTSVGTYNELKKQASDFANRRLAIENEYVENIKKLDRKSLGEEKYNEAVAIAEKIKAAKLAAIKEEEIKSNEAYKAISGQIEGVTRVAMKGYLDQLKLQLLTLDKQSDLYIQITKLIKDTEKGLRNQTIDDVNKIASGFRDASAFVRVFDEDLAGVVDSLSNVASGIARMMAGDYVGGGLQILTSIFSTIIESSDRAAKKAEERQQQILGDLQERLANINTLLERQIALINQLSGTDKLKGYADSFYSIGNDIVATIDKIDKLSSALDEYKATVQYDWLTGQFTGSNSGALTSYKELTGKDNDIYGVDLAYIKSLIESNNKNIERLYAQILNGDLSGDQVEQLKELIEHLEETSAKYEQLVDQYNEYLTGTTVASIADSIASGFEEGYSSAEDFADNFEGLMKKAMIQALKMKALEIPLQKWYEDFAAMAEDGLSSTDIEALRSAYDLIIGNASEQWEELQGILNEGGVYPQADNSLTGAIKGVSEETAGLIAGQMNAIRINQAQALSIMNNQLLELSRIEYNTRNNLYIKRIYDLLEASNNNSINSSRSVGGQ
ncbi:MAG: hypothetical protein KGZ82_04205 [Bacteroidales bacterium]|nr:hypothetical protein [Bacteroidales bacterium]